MDQLRLIQTVHAQRIQYFAYPKVLVHNSALLLWHQLYKRAHYFKNAR